MDASWQTLSGRRAGLLAIVVVVFSIVGCSHKPKPQVIDGAQVFNKKCASCHKVDNDLRAPEPTALREMSKTSIRRALESGKMKWEGQFLSSAEKKAVADYLGKADTPLPAIAIGYCKRDLDPPPDPPAWSGWGADLHNTRFQPQRLAKLDRDSVKNLKLRWAFGYAGAAATFGQPTSYAGRLFVGSEDGTVYSLDSATGCLWWAFRASGTVKTAISVSSNGELAFFGDTNGYIYALKTANGSLAWRAHPESHPAARITGSPLLAGGRLYVPVSSGEEGAAADPRYPCCTFRGAVAALDAATGKQIWKTYTIDDSPRPLRKSKQGVQYWGPSGAAVWSAPTADLKRHVIYVATGNNYSSPPTNTSDAVLALDMNSGRKLWHRQFTPADLWNSGCVAEQKENCPEQGGEDFDFGAPPILQHLPGSRDILLLGQKSGIVYALDPDRNGEILWTSRIGHGGSLGGIQWGGAVDGRYAYFPLSDFNDDDPRAGGGLFALNLRTGRQIWRAAPAEPACVGKFGCSAAQMAPATAIPGVVFSGSLDGHLRAYDSRDGTVIWDFDTAREFPTTNGVVAHGGSLNGAGPTVADGMVFVNAGYTNAMDGNILLAFSASSK